MNKFIPEKKVKEIISVRIDAALLNELDVVSLEIDISRNELINQCISYALSNIDFDSSKK